MNYFGYQIKYIIIINYIFNVALYYLSKCSTYWLIQSCLVYLFFNNLGFLVVRKLVCVRNHDALYLLHYSVMFAQSACFVNPAKILVY